MQLYKSLVDVASALTHGIWEWIAYVNEHLSADMLR